MSRQEVLGKQREGNMATASSGGPLPGASGNDGVIYADEDRGYGWLFFAGTVLGLAGLMRIIDAIWAFSYNGALPERLEDGVLGDSLTTYAWLWLVVGAVLILSSFLVLTRSQFARWVGFIAATIGSLSAMVWMPYYPIWSLTYVGIMVLTFYALARYAGRGAAAW
jgi:hypothetical protein